MPADDGVADDHARGNTVYVEVTENENQETVESVTVGGGDTLELLSPPMVSAGQASRQSRKTNVAAKVTFA